MTGDHTTIEIPSGAERILRALRDSGYEAYIVGGCVRDCLLGKEPADWDITTSARPEQVKAVFRKTVDTGIKHGTVTVLMNDGKYEVTTFRTDGVYTDHRHPDAVTFSPDLKEDLKRRDFTVNAMAYSAESGIVDLFGGMADMERKVIRAVGDPKSRFGEDALRMMRAVRFSAQLGYDIDPETAAAVKELAPTLSAVSGERIRDELEKLLVSDNPGRLRDLCELGLTAVFLPEFDRTMGVTQNNPHHRYTVGEHTLTALAASRCDRIVRLTVLLHDIAKPLMKTTDADGIDHFKGHPKKGSEMAGEILRRLREDNRTIARVKNLISWHDLRPGSDPVSVRKTAAKVEKYVFSDQETGLCIRPARSVAELVKEGKELSHCVASYAGHVAAGDTSILFVRKIEAPDVPYYTLEWKGKKIVQDHGKGNKLQTPDVLAFEKKWLDHVKKVDRRNKDGKRDHASAVSA